MALTLPTDRCFVIAEAGTNHAAYEYDMRLGKALNYICAAAEARADAVKFQWFVPDEPLFCPVDGDEHRRARWDCSHLKSRAWEALKRSAEERSLVFLASTFQHTTVQWLNDLGVVATKVASRAAKSFPYDKAPQPYLVSNGMLDDSIMVWKGFEVGALLWLECESKYPSRKTWSGGSHGFSDHSGTPWRAIDAISRGCKLIEVHYHLEEHDAGPDLPASLTLDELKLVCEARDAFSDLHKS